MLKPEQREAIYRLALQQQHADLSDYLDSITVPEGWQVVPVEPTREMLAAQVNGSDWNGRSGEDRARAVWAAMLAAAPKLGDSNEWMAELAARLRTMTTATMLDEYDMKAAADLIESMAQRVPLSEEQIYQVIEAARESYRAHTTGIRGQMLTIYDDMDWHLVRAVEQAHGIRSEK